MNTLSPLECAQIGAWLEAHDLGEGPLQEVSHLSGGTQNIMVRAQRGGEALVLRRGPEHLRSTTNRHLAREATVLQALAKTDVPHARLRAFCDDPDVWSGSVFYVMEYVDGFNATVELPEDRAGDPQALHAMGISVVESLARVGEIDPEQVGLTGVGSPEGFLDRQVPRWRSEYESYRAMDGYVPADAEGFAALGAWLEENKPESFRPGLMHGDFHLANVMFSFERPEVVAIIDWEMSTVADPLLDLGWLIAMWPENHDRLTGGVIGASGSLPSEQELVEAYARCSTRDLRGVEWYVVLACYKLGILLEGTYARSCAGLAPKATGERLRVTSRRLVAQGLRRINA